MIKKVPFKNNFDTAKKHDKWATIILYVSTTLLIGGFILSQNANASPLTIRSIEILNCITIVLYSILWFIVDYIHYGAEIYRREDLVDNSFGCLLAENRTSDYYTNDDLKSGLYKMGVNNFESCFFSYEIAKRELYQLWIKTVCLVVIFLFIAICGYDECLIFIIQLSIPIVLLQQAIKHTFFVSRLKNVLCRYRILFNRLKNSSNENHSPEIMRNILEYETLISWGNILLNDKIYRQMNASLSKEWESIKERYSIN